jgi:enamine deaminase RidA (YjgF/YER057c/UK114 family)
MEKAEFFVTPGYGERQLNGMHYSQAVKIGNRVETSGQGGWNDDWQFPESLADEIAQAFRNVERTLATAGAGWEHVVHVNSYHVGGFPPGANEVMVKLFRHYMPNHAPIWTSLGSRRWEIQRCVLKSALPQLFPEFRTGLSTGDSAALHRAKQMDGMITLTTQLNYTAQPHSAFSS